jgi:hypothetical protein
VKGPEASPTTIWKHLIELAAPEVNFG